MPTSIPLVCSMRNNPAASAPVQASEGKQCGYSPGTPHCGPQKRNLRDRAFVVDGRAVLLVLQLVGFALGRERDNWLLPRFVPRVT
jgi:hypothetical protein